jgi:hypothetical protein
MRGMAYIWAGKVELNECLSTVRGARGFDECRQWVAGKVYGHIMLRIIQ